MARLQMVSPESVETRLQDLHVANPGEADVVEDSVSLQKIRGPGTPTCSVSTGPVAPFATAVAEREMELAQSVLELDPGDPTASRVVEGELRKEERWEELSSALLKGFRPTEVWQKNRRFSPHSVKSMRRSSIPLKEHSLFSKALEQNPEDEEALENAIRVAEKGEHWELLYNLYIHLIDTIPSDEHRARVELEAGTLAAEHLGIAHRAIAHLEAVLRIRTEDSEAWMLLAHLLNEVGRDRKRFAPGKPHFNGLPMTARSSASPMEQKVLKSCSVASMRTPARIASSLRGSISCRVYLCPDRGLLPRSSQRYQPCGQRLARAEALAPEDPEVRAAVREVALRSGEALRESVLDAVAAAGEDLDKRESALRSAIHAKDRIGLTDEELCIFYEEVVSIAPKDPGILHEYFDLLMNLERHEEAESILDRRVQLTEEPDLKTSLLLDRSELLLKVLDRPIEAAQCLKEASELRPEDERLAKAHLRALENARDHDGMVDALRRRAQTKRNSPSRSPRRVGGNGG